MELTSAQKLRVAAALSQDGVTIRLDQKTAMQLARAMERQNEISEKISALIAQSHIMQARRGALVVVVNVEAFRNWCIRAVIIMGVVMSTVSWAMT